MAVEWPHDLPQIPRLGSLQQADKSNLARFEPDVGPSLVRRRSTVVNTRLEFDLTLTTDQVNRLVAFYRDTTADGATAFTWVDFHDYKTQITYRFDEPPAIANITAGAHQVRLVLERIN